MLTGRDVLVQREYYREQVRIAERARLARRAKPWGNVVLRMRSLLNWLGTLLVAWGTRLEREYEAVVTSPPAQPAVGR